MRFAAVSLGMFATLMLPACKGSEAVAKQVEWADKACACKDLACLEGIEKEQNDWIEKNGSTAQMTSDEQAKYDEAVKRMSACVVNIMTEGAGGGAAANKDATGAGGG